MVLSVKLVQVKFREPVTQSEMTHSLILSAAWRSDRPHSARLSMAIISQEGSNLSLKNDFPVFYLKTWRHFMCLLCAWYWQWIHQNSFFDGWFGHVRDLVYHGLLCRASSFLICLRITFIHSLHQNSIKSIHLDIFRLNPLNNNAMFLGSIPEQWLD